MRLIIPLILIALMLPYAVGEDKPSGEWAIPPSAEILASCAAFDARDAREACDACDATAEGAASARANDQIDPRALSTGIVLAPDAARARRAL